MGKRRSKEISKKDVDPKRKKRRKKVSEESLKPTQSDISPSADTSAPTQVPVLSCRGLRSASVVLDRDLWLWYCTANKKPGGTKVSKRLVQARAKWAFHRAGITNFKASDGWYRRWISRWRRYSSEQLGSQVPQPKCQKAQPQKKLKNCSTTEGQLVDSLQILREVAMRELSRDSLSRRPEQILDSTKKYPDLVEDVMSKEQQEQSSFLIEVPDSDISRNHNLVMNDHTAFQEQAPDFSKHISRLVNSKLVSESVQVVNEERTVCKSYNDKPEFSNPGNECDVIDVTRGCTTERSDGTGAEFVSDMNKCVTESDAQGRVVDECAVTMSASVCYAAELAAEQTRYELVTDLDLGAPIGKNVTAIDFISNKNKSTIALINPNELGSDSVRNNILNERRVKISDSVSNGKEFEVKCSNSDLESNYVHNSINEPSKMLSKCISFENVPELVKPQNDSVYSNQESGHPLTISEAVSDIACGSQPPSSTLSSEAICSTQDSVETMSISDKNERVTDLTIPSTSFIVQKEIDKLLKGTNIDLVPEINPSLLVFNTERNDCRTVFDIPKNVETNLINLYDIFHSPTSDSLDSMLYYTAMNGVTSHHHHSSSATLPESNLTNILDAPDQTNNKNTFLLTNGYFNNERLKDIFSVNQNNKNNQLDGLLPDGSVMQTSSAAENENSVSTFSSESSQDFIESVFRDVSLSGSSKSEVCFSESLSGDVQKTVSKKSVKQLCNEVSAVQGNSQNVINSNCHKSGVKKSAVNSVGSKFQPCKNGKRYLPQFKDKVLSYVANHTFKETAKKFRVHQESITSWKTDKARRKLTSRRSSKSSRKTVAPAVEPMDEQFLSWLRRSRERRHKLTSVEVRDHAKELMAQCTRRGEACWFTLWVSRFDEKVYEEGMEDIPRRGEEQRHIQYPAGFRTEVAAFADCYSQAQASRIFCVSRKRVFEWLKTYRDKPVEDDTGKINEPTINKHGSRRTVTDVDVDQQIWSWYQEQLSSGSKPKGDEVRLKGVSLYRERGHTGIQCSYSWYKRWCDRFGVVLRYDGDDALLAWTLTQLDRNRAVTHHDLQEHARELWQRRSPQFKASAGWAIRFCKRHPKLLQQVPAVHTPLPPALLTSVDEFRVKVQRMIREKPFPPCAVGNMDELHLNFSTPLSASSKRHLLLRKSGMQNCHATIVLACLADGNMLTPTVILKGRSSCELALASSDLPILHQEDGQMDTTCMEQWLKLVWFKQVASPSLLVVDCFDPHSASSLAEEFSSRQSDVVIIPGGCTSKLQPLDINIKRNFQLLIEKQWLKVNSCSANSWSSSCNFHVPSAKELLDWVKEAHLHVQTTKQETIRRSFLVTGLTVAANHSEDHFIENISMMPTDEDHESV